MDRDYNTLIELIKKYNEDEINNVIKAYEFAKEAHKGQFRESK